MEVNVSIREHIEDIDWGVGTRLAVIVTVTMFVIGIIFTKLGVFELTIRSIFPLLMLLFPWFWTWAVPRRYFIEQAPEMYVLVFGWAGIIYNSIRVFANVYV